jgi:hypothetical protein
VRSLFSFTHGMPRVEVLIGRVEDPQKSESKFQKPNKALPRFDACPQRLVHSLSHSRADSAGFRTTMSGTPLECSRDVLASAGPDMSLKKRFKGTRRDHGKCHALKSGRVPDLPSPRPVTLHWAGIVLFQATGCIKTRGRRMFDNETWLRGFCTS